MPMRTLSPNDQPSGLPAATFEHATIVLRLAPCPELRRKMPRCLIQKPSHRFVQCATATVAWLLRTLADLAPAMVRVTRNPDDVRSARECAGGVRPHYWRVRRN